MLKLATASLAIALVVLSSRLSLAPGLDCSAPMRLKDYLGVSDGDVLTLEFLN